MSVKIMFNEICSIIIKELACSHYGDLTKDGESELNYNLESIDINKIRNY